MTHRPVPQRPQPRSLILITALITLGVLAGAEEKDPTTSLLSLFQNLDEAPLAEVRRLVYAGAEVDAVTTSGYRLVNEAAATGRADVVELLANAGADVNASHPTTGLVPLLLAAFGGHAETVRVLLDAGADVSITANNDVSVLDAAAVGGDTAVVALLLNAGADVNAAAANGVTPLFVAASEGHPQIARQLLDAGADVNATRLTDGLTCVDVALQEGHAETARLLIDAGAKVSRSPESAGDTSGQEQTDDLLDLLPATVVVLPRTYRGTSRSPPVVAPPTRVPVAEFLHLQGPLIVADDPRSIFYSRMPNEIGLSSQTGQTANALIQETLTTAVVPAMTRAAETASTNRRVAMIVGGVIGLFLTGGAVKLVNAVLVRMGKEPLGENPRIVVGAVLVLGLAFVGSQLAEGVYGTDPPELYVDNATESDISLEVNSTDRFELAALSNRVLKLDPGRTICDLVVDYGAGSGPSVHLRLALHTSGWHVLNVAGSNRYTVHSAFYVVE